MKVTCQSCQAKYTIADEKVRGKVAKIRCKKCGTTILVDGTDGAPGAASSAQTADQGWQSGDVWKVIGADGAERSLTLAELTDLYAKGEVSDDTSAWKEGMAEWLPIAKIDGLRAALGAIPDSMLPASAVLSGPGAIGAVGQATAATLEQQAAPVTAPKPPLTDRIKAPEPVALRRPGRSAGADLFGASRHDDGMTSPASPVFPHASSDTSGDKLTGARNENSVLFSLSALTSGHPGEAAPISEAVPSSRSADLRSLISSAKSAPSPKDSKLDDIMNLGGGGLYAPSLIGPALAPPPLEFSASTDDSARRPKGKGRLAAIVGAVVILGGAAVAFTTLNGTGETPKTASSAMAPSTSAAAAAAATSTTDLAPPGTTETPPASATAAKGTTEPAASATASASPAEPAPAGAATVMAPGQQAPKAEPAWKPAPVARSDTPRVEKVAVAPTEKAEKPVALSPPPAAPAAAAPPPANGTGDFDRAAVMSTLSATATASQSCKKSDGPTGAGRVAVTYASNGTATTAVIEGPPFAGTAVGGCVAARFRATRIPPFGGSPMTVHKSFNIN